MCRLEAQESALSGKSGGPESTTHTEPSRVCEKLKLALAKLSNGWLANCQLWGNLIRCPKRMRQLLSIELMISSSIRREAL